MPEQIVDLLVEGGQAKAGPQLAQPLAPLGVNIQQIISKINEKTTNFKGMKVPVKVTVETSKKSFEIEVGSPPVSELIKGEASVDKGSGEPNKKKIANLGIEQVIKIAKMKQDSMLVNNLKSAVKTIIGSCNSAGILVEGKSSTELNKEIDDGKFDNQIEKGITELSSEKKSILDSQLKEVQLVIQKLLEKEKAEKEAEEAEKKKIVEAEVAREAEEKAAAAGEVKEAAKETKETPPKEEKKA